jgi:predicted Zn-dependent protease
MKFNFTQRLTALVVCILLFNTCARNPVTGKKELSLMSTNQEISMGRQYDPSVQATFGVYEDAKLQAFIGEKGKAMAAISHRPQLPYQFKVLDSPVVNAFAVPGGFVYFTRGIMAHFNNEAEFAGVLGHEIGHVTARHSARQQTSQTLGQLGLIIGVVASEQFRQYADVANQAMGLLFLKFGRDHETQSDKLGVEYSTKIGYNAHEMADFFTTLKRLGEKSGASGIPSFLSTHPDPGDRYNNTHALATAIQKGKDPASLAVNRDSYLRMIDGIIYGDDPKQGFVENNTFYHPELKFQFPIPTAWKHQNSPLEFQMAPDNGNAMMLLALAPGRTLDSAAANTVKQYSLKVLESRRTTINGNPAIELISEQVAQQQQGQQQQPQQQVDPSKVVKVATWLIQYNGLIYGFHGLTYAPLFNNYYQLFANTPNGFRVLSDPDKLNRQPERIRIQTVPRDAALRDALTALNMPAARLEELSILNGMQLTENVQKGMLIKTIAR